jgi:isopentenyl-diphosphate Delta-isomerase
LIQGRKLDHIRINLEEQVQFPRLRTGLDQVRFVHQALPELDLDHIDTRTQFFGKELQAPLLISSMTGGTTEAQEINRNLAQAAQTAGVAMGLGSQRAALEDPSLAKTFRVRQHAPDILLFANLGAIQLNYGYGVSDCLRAVEMVKADALILHLNPLQEAVQSEGDRNWSGLVVRIGTVCRRLPVPVIVKEVGWGLSRQAVRQLTEAGVAALDVAGAGGTSWSEVEYHRSPSQTDARIAAAFADWGLTTLESLLIARSEAPQVPTIASGGIRDGIDVAKVVALGASLAGIAGPFLKAAVESSEEVEAKITEIRAALRIAMFAAGAANLGQLAKTLVIRPELPAVLES